MECLFFFFFIPHPAAGSQPSSGSHYIISQPRRLWHFTGEMGGGGGLVGRAPRRRSFFMRPCARRIPFSWNFKRRYSELCHRLTEQNSGRGTQLFPFSCQQVSCCGRLA